MSLQGATQLRARLMAVRDAPKDIESRWARTTVPIMRGSVRSKTGRTRASVRAQGNTIQGSAVVNVLDSGAKAHDIISKDKTLKFQAGGTLFRRKVHKPQQRGQHFKRRAAEEGARKIDLVGLLIAAWNRVA